MEDATRSIRVRPLLVVLAIAAVAATIWAATALAAGGSSGSNGSGGTSDPAAAYVQDDGDAQAPDNCPDRDDGSGSGDSGASAET
jgi:hypothetical protein